MATATPDRTKLIGQVVIRLIIFFPMFGAFFFLPAGTLLYWEAWTYLGVLFIPLIFIGSYLLKHEPDLLQRRMNMREKRTEQKSIVSAAGVVLILAYVLPGFDKRFGWSQVPAGVVLFADALVLLGYIFVMRVFVENRYASRVIEISTAQKVITTGPYAFVRHPMYLGVLVMYIFSPLALGSYWAMLPAILLIPVLVARIIDEEKFLVSNLEGYAEYKLKTKYRLLPGVW